MRSESPPPPPFGAEEFRRRLDSNNWRGAKQIMKQNIAILNVPGDDGMTPLQAAIAVGNLTVVNELLTYPELKIGDALLHAVGKGDRVLIEIIMEALRKRNLPTTGPFEDTTHFKFYTTPLMLACLKEDYNLVGYFLKNGHVLKFPHGADCGCDSCAKDHPNGEKLEDKMRRIDSYAAASSCAFILYQKDPFDYAMSLCYYLEECKSSDPAYSLKYEYMIEKLNELTFSLISNCDKKDLIEIILRRRQQNTPADACVFGFPRVNEALKTHQKQFLSQPGCHSVIYDAFCGTWKNMYQCRRAKRLSRIALHSVLYAFTSLIFVFSGGRFPSSYGNPVARLLSSFSSYVIFLVMLIFHAQYKEERSRLGMPAYTVKNVVLAYIYAYVAGILAVFLTDLRRLGVQRLFDVWWRKFDFLFLVVWSCTLFSYIDAIINARYHGFYQLHRVHWRPAEPQLVYEIWFTWAAILSSVRLFYYAQLFGQFGAVTISITRCIPTILRYVVVLFVVLASFAIGLNHMYEHYKYNFVERDGTTIEQPFHSTSLFTMARYLYWVYYGYLPPEVWEPIVGNVGYGDKKVETRHHLIWNTGELMSGIYYAIELLVLLNLMVALMTVAAISVVHEAFVDWNYVRAEIWTEHFHDSRSVPPPFNLLQLLVHGSICIVRKLTGPRGRPLSVWDYKYQPPVHDPSSDIKYKEIISALKDRLRMKLSSAGG